MPEIYHFWWDPFKKEWIKVPLYSYDNQCTVLCLKCPTTGDKRKITERTIIFDLRLVISSSCFPYNFCDRLPFSTETSWDYSKNCFSLITKPCSVLDAENRIHNFSVGNTTLKSCRVVNKPSKVLDWNKWDQCDNSSAIEKQVEKSKTIGVDPPGKSAPWQGRCPLLMTSPMGGGERTQHFWVLTK